MSGTATHASSWVTLRSAIVLRVVLALNVALPVNAQTLIRVSGAGYPAQNAEVIAWDSGGRIAAGRTDVLGAVHLAPTRVPSTGAFLIVRRLGFVPARVAFVGGDSIAISLIATPTTLPVLSTSSKALTCPAANEPAADSLWRTAASHYSIGAVNLYTAWIGGTRKETVPADQRGYGDGEPIRMVGGGGTFPDTSARADILMHSPPPYALYERHVNLLGAGATRRSKTSAPSTSPASAFIHAMTSPYSANPAVRPSSAFARARATRPRSKASC